MQYKRLGEYGLSWRRHCFTEGLTLLFLSVSGVITTQAAPLQLTLTINPTTYEIDQALQGQGSITNPNKFSVDASFGNEIFQNKTLKSTADSYYLTFNPTRQKEEL